MLIVKTFLGSSDINGIGCFADEFIPMGSVIWKLEKDFDAVFSVDEFNQLPEIAQIHINHFAYFNEEDGGYVLCSDNAKFFNHSSDPNTWDEPSLTIAKRDIKQGEEIVSDYFTFDGLVGIKDLPKN